MTTYTKARHETTKTKWFGSHTPKTKGQQQPMAEWEELNDLDLEKLVGGGCPGIDPATYNGPIPPHCEIVDGQLICR